MSEDPVTTLYKYIEAGDRLGADEFVAQWAASHNYEKAITDLLEPALKIFGKKWSMSENVTLAQGYIAGKIAEDIMQKAVEKQQKITPDFLGTKGPLVIGNIEDDFHALGRKMVTTFLQASGWKVYDIGNDTLASEFVDKAEEVGAKIIGASAMMYTNAMNIKKLRQEIDNRGLKGRLQLAVGGAVFVLRPKLVEEVGGDGTAPNAVLADKLMTELWKKALQG